MLTTVLLTYAVRSDTGVLRVISPHNGKILLTQPAGVTPIAALSDGSGLRYFLAQDSSLIRLYSLQRLALQNAPRTPQLLFPPNTGYAPSDTITLRWRASAWAQSYKVHVDRAQPPNLDREHGIIDSVTTDTTLTFVGSRAYQYYWRVLAQNEFGEAASAEDTFQIALLPPLAPMLYYPASGSNGLVLPVPLGYIGTDSPEPGHTASSFHLQVKGDSTLSRGRLAFIDNIVGSETLISGARTPDPALSPEGATRTGVWGL